MALDITFKKSDIPFFQIIRSRVNLYFTERKISKTGNHSLIFKSLLILLAFSAFYFFPLMGDWHWFWLLLSYSGLGFSLALIGFNIMHDGSHEAYSSSKVVNKWTALSLNFLGGNAGFWKQKHCINHHTFTNIEHVDDDIDLAPFLRLHEGQPHRWFHTFQHVYAPFIYCLTLIFWIHYRDYKKYFTQKIAKETPMETMSMGEHLLFWFSKIVHFSIFLIIPSLVLGVQQALFGYLLACITCGFTLAIVFQLAHIVEGTHFETPCAAKKVSIETDWCIHQIRTTVNFATRNKVVSWLLGGLNFQMVHHLFPKISHVHYPAIHQIITETCKEYGVPYVEYDSVGSAIGSHLRYLHEMGKNEPDPILSPA